MKISREEMLEAIDFCLHAVDRSASFIEGTDTVVINGNKMYSYNDREIVIRTLSDSCDFFCVRIQDMHRVISKYPQNSILEISPKKERLYINAEKIKSYIPLIDTQIYTLIEANFDNIDKLSWKNVPELFFDGLLHSHIDGYKFPRLPGVFIDKNVLKACDGFFISVLDMKEPFIENPFWLNKNVVSFLSKNKFLSEYTKKADWLFFKGGNSIFGCRSLDVDSFPSEKVDDVYKEIMGTKEIFKIKLEEKDRIKSAIDRIALFKMEESGRAFFNLKVEGKEVSFFSENEKGGIFDVIDLKEEIIKDKKVILIPLLFFKHGVLIYENITFSCSKGVDNKVEYIIFVSDNSLFSFMVEEK